MYSLLKLINFDVCCIFSGGWESLIDDNSALISALLTVVIIFIILLGSICFAVKQCFCIKCRSSSNPDEEDIQRSLLARSYRDPPPRYSVVVCTSGDQNGSHSSLEDEISQRRLSQTGSIDSVFYIPTPPPNYSQALLDLAEKGIIFNPESLNPMPPAYVDANLYPLISAGS